MSIQFQGDIKRGKLPETIITRSIYFEANLFQGQFMSRPI